MFELLYTAIGVLLTAFLFFSLSRIYGKLCEIAELLRGRK